MRKLINRLLFWIMRIILVVLIVGAFALIAFYCVKYFSGYHLDTPQLTVIGGIAGLLVGNFFYHYRKVQVTSEIEDKKLSIVNKNVNNLLEQVNRNVKQKDNSRWI